MAQNQFIPTEAFEHRYASTAVVREILEKQFGFKSKEIEIRASQGNGVQVRLPRKLKENERERVNEELDNSRPNA
ncbi:hypothetical protein QBC34DRAFT_383423 [Podospora aff. communis PSN243]|uniref:Uncharacterized protein n=1 Tax=Podospora aff. communis PSN243 TaxID=3040156 RepID=A0AAV9GG71_9PEZI|nr:hypothetical protein QBC34DRAFT_383423 [Podospora aff. communis PSN243]